MKYISTILLASLLCFSARGQTTSYTLPNGITITAPACPMCPPPIFCPPPASITNSTNYFITQPFGTNYYTTTNFVVNSGTALTSPPLNLTFSNVGSTSVQASWVNQNIAASNYVCLVTAILPPGSTSYTFTGLTPGLSYTALVANVVGNPQAVVTTSNVPPPTSFLAQINTGGTGNIQGWQLDQWNAQNTSTMTVSASPGVTNAPQLSILQNYATNSTVTVGPITGMIPNKKFSMDIWVFEPCHNAANRNETINVVGATTFSTNNVDPWLLAGGKEFVATDIQVTGVASSNGTVTVWATYVNSDDHNAILGPIRVQQAVLP